MSTIIAVLMAFLGFTPAAGSGIQQLSPLTVSGGTVQLASSTASFRIPSLVGCDTIDTDSTGILACGTDSGGGASSFSTTSANYWSSVGLAFSTTSTNYWQTQTNFFSTTSANFWSSVGLGHATTSVAYQLTQNVTLGNATATAFFATRASSTNLATLNGTSTKFACVFCTLTWASTTALTVSGNSYLGTVTSGTWNGTAITDSFISSGTLWHQKVSSTSIDTLAELETFQGGINIIQSTEIDTSSELSGILGDETGSGGAAVFASGPTLTGNTTYANITGTNATSTTLFATFASTTNATTTKLFSPYSTLTWASTTALTVSGNSYLGTVTSGTWNGTAITDSFISSGTLWHQKVSSTSIDTCAELATFWSGQTTGTCGSIVFSAAPTFTGNATAANLTITNATTTTFAATHASTTNQRTNNATTTSLYLTGVQNAVLLTTSGQVGAASAQTCTNQFLRAMSAAYVATCATVQSEDINLADAFAWTGAHDFGAATDLEIPNGTSPTVDAIGEIALDTTSNYLLVASSTNSSYPTVHNPDREYTVTFASSTIAYLSSGTSTFQMGAPSFAELVSKMWCYTDTGTTTVRYGDGTNWMPYHVFGPLGTELVITSNNAFTSREERQLEIKNTAGTPNQSTCTITSRVTRD